MRDDDLVATLEDAGLSPYQAEAYVALLELGNATATDVADACDVPDPRIYDVLRDLESKGYVETYQQDTLTARAHDPSEVLEDLRARSNRYLDAADAIEERWNQPAVTEHEVSIVKRFQTVLNRAEALIAEAETQVQVGLTVDQFADLRDALAGAHDRGVTVKVTLYTDDDDASLPGEDVLAGTCTEARHRPIPSPFVAVVDRQWTCFAPHHCSVNEYGVLVNDRTYTHVFHWFFLTCLWEIWEPVYTARSPGPPTRYVDVRPFVSDVEPLIEDGARVSVTVDGYWTEANESVELAGDVVDVTYSAEPSGDDERVSLAQLAGRVSFTVDTGEDTVEVGGWGAVLEEVEASTITVTSVCED